MYDQRQVQIQMAAETSTPAQYFAILWQFGKQQATMSSKKSLL